MGQARVDQTQGFVFSADETTDIGYESGTKPPARTTTRTPAYSNGKINWWQIDLGKDSEDADHYVSPEERLRVAMARQ